MKYERLKRANAVLKKIDVSPIGYYIIHYSCESFYDTSDGKSPRITSIAILSLDTRQTESFSIHKIAEKNHIAFGDIEQHYDELELKMLQEYYTFIQHNKSASWIHWNMRNPNYGFQALDHRYMVLGGVPESIPDERKIDFSRILHDKFGSNYIGNPRFESLIDYNGIKPKDFLGGKEEAAAFEAKEFIKLHLSTLSKVYVLAQLLEKTIEKTLKTKASWKEVYGVTPQGIFEFSRERWYFQMALSLLSLILGAVLSIFIK